MLLKNCYCINLKYRRDRWDVCKKEFEKVDLQVNRWEGYSKSKIHPKEVEKIKTIDSYEKRLGVLSCLRAHKSLIEYAKRKDFNVLTVFEDDVQFFYRDFKSYVKKIEFHLPEKWNLIFYGARKRVVSPYRCKHLRYLKKFVCAHSYSVHRKAYNIILNIIKHENNEYDVLLNKLCKYNSVFITYPLLCGQYHSYSDIHNKFMTHEFKSDHYYNLSNVNEPKNREFNVGEVV